MVRIGTSEATWRTRFQTIYYLPLTIYRSRFLICSSGGIQVFKAKIYGDFAVKFRAFGVDFGYVKKSIALADAVLISSPVAFPSTVPIMFEKFGIRVDAYILKA